MEALDQTYLSQLNTIKANIQGSEILSKYLDEEEDELYFELKSAFEPGIEALYVAVADKDPMQLIAFEEELLDEGYEGLFLPRILGYAVLRGEINDAFKYKIPQDHFKKILLSISDSSNFDLIKNRIGQSVQIGFALSSDIWITNFLNEITNKKVRSFYSSLKNERFRDVRDRHTSLVKYSKQFQSLNYQTALFPSNITELKVHSGELMSFLLYRANRDFDNSSLRKFLIEFINRDEFLGEKEFTKLMMIIGMFTDLEGKNKEKVESHFTTLRKNSDFENEYFVNLIHYLNDPSVEIVSKQDLRMSTVISKTPNDEIAKYYTLLEDVHSRGYVHDEVIENVRQYYYQHAGLSKQNECLRSVILNYFGTFIGNLNEDNYLDYFEINKTFAQYMGIFNNEKFNQEVKGISLKYIKRLIKKYPDKRGRHYQDIKKFVSSTFLDLGFMKQKEIVELFKTKRKKKEA